MKLKLITEMPLVGYHVKPNVADGKPLVQNHRGRGREPFPGDEWQGNQDLVPRSDGFSKQSANALQSPKVHEQLTKVLNRSDRHKIIIISDTTPPGVNNSSLSFSEGDGETTLDDQYYLDAGIDPKLAKDAITIVLSIDNSENNHHLSPWMILHQIGEIASVAGGMGWWYGLADKYGEQLGLNNRGMQWEIDSQKVFARIFNMKSARSSRETDVEDRFFVNIDTEAELVTEYLWYGGQIRVNYPDGIDRKVIDAIKDELEFEIGKKLDSMVGKAYDNDLAYEGND
jgi:hypothetical protein